MLSLISGANIASDSMGTFHAKTLHVWLHETPRRSKAKETHSERFDVRPDRLLAIGQVAIDSPQLEGEMGRLEVWFNYQAAPAAPPAPPEAAGAANANRGSNSLLQLRTNAPEKRRRKFSLHGNTVRLGVVMRGKEELIEAATVDGSVRVIEILSPGSSDTVTQLQGNRFELREGTSENPQLSLVGEALDTTTSKPATIQTDGIQLSGAAIHLHQGANQAWIDGPGKMTIAGQNDKKQPVRQPVEIVWQGGMNFDGLTAQIRDNVRITGRQLTEKGETHVFDAFGTDARVELSARVNLKRLKSKTPAKPRLLRFVGRVHAENRTYDSNQQQISFDRMDLLDLEIDQITGRLHANGPGRLSSVRFDKTPQTTKPRFETTAVEAEQQLFYVSVAFNREANGNVHRRELTFTDQIQALYGPVNDWESRLDERTISSRRGDGSVMWSRSLTIANMATNKQQAIELISRGNVRIEGRENVGFFTATGETVKYVQRKNVLILEGDGRRRATLTRQARIGAEPQYSEMQRIVYNTKTDAVSIDDVRSFDVTGNPGRRDARSSRVQPQPTPSTR